MNLNNLSTERLKAYVASHGKKVNQRIVTLEEYGQRNVFAYRYVSDSIPDYMKEKSQSGHLKLNIKTRGKTRNELLELATVIQNVENAKTSTLKGIKKTYNKMKRETEKALGVELSDMDFQKTFGQQAFKNFSEKFGSKQYVRMVKEYGYEETQKAIEKAYSENIQTLFDIESIITKNKFNTYNEDDFGFEDSDY